MRDFNVRRPPYFFFLLNFKHFMTVLLKFISIDNLYFNLIHRLNKGVDYLNIGVIDD